MMSKLSKSDRTALELQLEIARNDGDDDKVAQIRKQLGVEAEPAPGPATPAVAMVDGCPVEDAASQLTELRDELAELDARIEEMHGQSGTDEAYDAACDRQREVIAQIAELERQAETGEYDDQEEDLDEMQQEDPCNDESPYDKADADSGEYEYDEPGGEYPDEQDDEVCPNCGHDEQREGYCAQCGNPLTAEAKAEITGPLHDEDGMEFDELRDEPHVIDEGEPDDLAALERKVDQVDLRGHRVLVRAAAAIFIVLIPVVILAFWALFGDEDAPDQSVQNSPAPIVRETDEPSEPSPSSTSATPTADAQASTDAQANAKRWYNY